MHDIREIQRYCHSLATEKGFWKHDHLDKGELLAIAKLMLIVSEVSECVEELRKPFPDRRSIAEEMADTVIRILDWCEQHGIDIQEEIEAKMKINQGREFRHGKRF